MTEKVCSRCIYDQKILGINFDKNGICNYCLQIENLLIKYNTDLPAAENKFNLIINEIKDSRKNKKYDCIIRDSGGTNSSYLLDLAKKIWHSFYLQGKKFFIIFNNINFDVFCLTYFFVMKVFCPFFQTPNHNQKIQNIAAGFPNLGKNSSLKLALVSKKLYDLLTRHIFG
jgi:hypothetical protein